MPTPLATRLYRRSRRRARIRGRASGTPTKPRLAVFKSNRYVHAQLIDDTRGHTLASAHSRDLSSGGTGREQARAVGEQIAKQAREQQIEHVVFDRGGFTYAGKVQEVADAARAGGLTF